MDLSRSFGYGVAALSLVFGVIVLWGLGIPEGVPSQFRVTMGVVLVLLGIYRFAVTKMRSGEATRGRL